MSSIKGLDKLFNNLSVVQGSLEKIGKKAVGKWTKSVQANAKLNCIVSTGELRNSIKTDVEILENEIKGKVYTNSEKAPYVEFGTGPTGNGTYKYSIKGYKPHYKADKWKVNIPDVGVRWIAGQVAKPFMTTAYLEEENSKNGVEILEKSIKEDIGKLGSGKND